MRRFDLSILKLLTRIFYLPAFFSARYFNISSLRVQENEKVFVLPMGPTAFGDTINYCYNAWFYGKIHDKKIIPILVKDYYLAEVFLYFFDQEDIIFYNEFFYNKLIRPLYALVGGKFRNRADNTVMKSLAKIFSRQINSGKYLDLINYESVYVPRLMPDDFLYKETFGAYNRIFFDDGVSFLLRHQFKTYIERINNPHIEYILNRKQKDELQLLFKKLGINRKYILLYIRSAKYLGGKFINRSITDFGPYIQLVEFLLSCGYQVVRLGTGVEEKLEVTHKDYIEYSHSQHQNTEHDLMLPSECEMFIHNWSGPSMISLIYNKPSLAVDCIQLSASPAILPNHRFYPKRIRKKDGSLMTIGEWLEHSFLYEVDIVDESIRLECMTGEDLINAAQEMFSMIKSNTFDQVSDLQQRFKDLIQPKHGTLYFAKGLPCHCYLVNNSNL